MLKLILSIFVIFFIVGCAQLDPNYTSYLSAQQSLIANHKTEPLFRMKACTGCTIELKGIDELVVNAPDANKLPQIQQVKDNEWVGVAKAAIQTAGSVGGTAVIVGGAVDIAQELRKAGTAGYEHIQSQPGNITNSYNTQGDNAAIGGSATTTASGDGSAVGGSGSSSNPVNTNTASGNGASTGGDGNQDSSVVDDHTTTAITTTTNNPDP